MSDPRLFIAVNLPVEVKKELAVFCHGLGAYGREVKWVEEENYHLTVKFLGETPTNRLKAVEEALTRAAGEVEAFALQLGGLGAFPHLKRPKVIWLGLISGREALVNLHSRVDRELAGVGLPADVKSFTPHLTLARVKAPEPPLQLVNQLVRPKEFQMAKTVEVTTIDLMASQLTSKGPAYRILSSFQLKKGTM